MTNCCIHQLVYPRYQEGIFGASFVQICEIHTHSPFPVLLYHNYIGQPFGVKHLFYGSYSFKFDHLFLDSLRMLFKGMPRWLFPRGNHWVNVQMVTNEVWIHPGSLISAPSKYIHILPKEGNQLFLLLERLLNPYLKVPIIIVVYDNLLQLFTFCPLSCNLRGQFHFL